MCETFNGPIRKLASVEWTGSIKNKFMTLGCLEKAMYIGNNAKPVDFHCLSKIETKRNKYS